MTKPLHLLISIFFCIFFSFTSVFSQPTQIDSLKSLISSSADSTRLKLHLQLAKAYEVENIETQLLFEVAQKEADLENAALENKLKEQQLNEANFQLFTILFISIVTAGFVISFYFLLSKRLIAEREAQELQVEALKKRLLELQLKHEGAEKTIDIAQINQELTSPLTEPEMEALQLRLKGFPNSEISEKLFVSINTVKFHLRNTYQKLDVKGKKEVLNFVTKPL